MSLKSLFTKPPPAARPEPQLVIGTVAHKGRSVPLALAPSERRRHKRVTGTSGAGKSFFIAWLAVALHNLETPFCLIDPHSDTARLILQLLLDTGYYDRPEGYDRLRYFSFHEDDRFVPFNVLDQPFPPDVVATNVLEAFRRAFPSLEAGAVFLENTVLYGVLVLATCERPLTDIVRLLSDKPFRDSCLARVPETHVHEFFTRWEAQGQREADSTLRRVQLLQFAPALRYSLSQIENALSPRRLMDDRVSVICDIGSLPEQTQRFLGALLTLSFQEAALSRASLPEPLRHEYHLVVDEYALFAANSETSLIRILDQARKFSVFLTIANQYEGQLGAALEGSLQNAVSIAFRLGAQDAARSAAHFTNYDPERVKHWGRYQPVYYSRAEQVQETATALEHLAPQEAFIRLGERVERFRTLTIPPPRRDIRPILARYKDELLRPKSAPESSCDTRADEPLRRRAKTRRDDGLS